MQSFTAIPDTTTLQASRNPLLDNTRTVMSANSGSTFPTAEVQVGMFCFRSDQNKLYELKSIGPDTWVLIADLTKTYLSKEGADALYQPISAELAAIVAISALGFLKRTATATWSTVVSTVAGEALLTAVDASAQRTALGLGTAALKNTGTAANQIVVLDANGNAGIGAAPDATSKLNLSGTLKTSAGVLGANGNGARTVSTAAPSGGADGDVWYQV